MLTKIELKNFKCFKDEIQFPLRQINLLTGKNGLGKSTLLQFLLLMRQSIEHSEFTTQILLNGSCVKLGNFVDVRNSNISRDESIVLKFCLQTNINDTVYDKYIEYYLRENLDDDMVAEISQINFCNQFNLDNNVPIKREYSKSENNNYFNINEYSNNGFQNLGNFLLTNLIPNDSDPTLVDESFNFSHVHYISADRIGT